MKYAKPMDEAPKDGTEILLLMPASEEANFEGGWIQGRYFSSPKQIDDGWETIIGSIGEPTHWMHLPEMPRE